MIMQCPECGGDTRHSSVDRVRHLVFFECTNPRCLNEWQEEVEAENEIWESKMNVGDFVAILVGEFTGKLGEIKRVDGLRYWVEIIDVDGQFNFGDGQLAQIDDERYWQLYYMVYDDLNDSEV